MSDANRGAVSWFNSNAVSVCRYFICTSLALIVIFAWIEPSGASGIGFWKGLLFWAVQISILIPLLIAVQHLASHYVNLQTPQNAWVQTTLSGLVGAILFVPIAYFLDTIFAIPGDGPNVGLVAGLLDEASGVVVPVTVTWLALNAPWIFQLDFSRKRSEVAEQTSTLTGADPSPLVEQPTRFLQELRNRAAGDLISISSELHYVRVVTTEGEVMFLYNLKDAIDELPAGSGVHIHRSHWVSREHVKGLGKKNGHSECILSNGRSLPVSRRKFSEVKDLLTSTVS